MSEDLFLKLIVQYAKLKICSTCCAFVTPTFQRKRR